LVKNENFRNFEFFGLPGAVEDPNHQERVLSAHPKDYFQRYTHGIPKLVWIICPTVLD